MKRAVIGVLVLALTGILAGSAQAAKSVSSKAVGQSRAAVVSYWTAERMRNATPVARAKGGGANGQKQSYPFTRYEAPQPYNAAHGKVFFSSGSTNYVCSGTALTSGNRSVVWTAGHCVNEGPGAYYTNWAFVPAYKDGARPYGTWPARQLLTTAPWQQSGDFGHDLGAAVVSTNASGQTLDSVIGSTRGIRFNYNASQTYLSHGYPAARPFDGSDMFICEAPLGLRDTSADPPTMGIGCDMTGGSSGGGWVVGNDVYSVNSYGYGSLRNVMFGPYQDSVAESLYTTAASR